MIWPTLLNHWHPMMNEFFQTVRFVECGRFFHRVMIDELTFADAEGRELAFQMVFARYGGVCAASHAGQWHRGGASANPLELRHEALAGHVQRRSHGRPS